MSWLFNYNLRKTHGPEPRTSLDIKTSVIGPKLHHGRLRRLLRSIPHAGTTATPRPPDSSLAYGAFSAEMNCADARERLELVPKRHLLRFISLISTASTINWNSSTCISFIPFFMLSRSKRIPSRLMFHL